MPSKRSSAGAHYLQRKAKAMPTPRNRFPRTGKYNNRGFRIDEIFFHSEAEANRYVQLKALAAAGRINRIETQVNYVINIDGHNICSYLADFRYAILDRDGNVTALAVEDVKGLATPEYRLKKKLVEAKHRIEIIELPASWLKHYDNLTGPECKPVIKELTKLQRQRASARKEVRRLAAEKMRAGRIALDKAITEALDEAEV